VAEARGHPEVIAKKSIKDVADHYDEVIRGSRRSPPSSDTRSAG
jgi:hypothetical protein